MSAKTYEDGLVDGAERTLRGLEEKTRNLKGNAGFRAAIKDYWNAVKYARKMLAEIREVRAASDPDWPPMVAS